jgi:phospholipid-transporting ATPase
MSHAFLAQPSYRPLFLMIFRSMEQFQKAIRKVRQVQRMRKQRGYAFSQADESQTRVLQAYDTTRERGRYGEMASSKPLSGGF